jgi:hypothetical protein
MSINEYNNNNDVGAYALVLIITSWLTAISPFALSAEYEKRSLVKCFT